MMIDIIRKNWNDILEKIKIEYEISKPAFETWLQPLKVHSFVGNTIYISIPENLESVIDYVIKKYKLPLQVTISELLNQPVDVEIIDPDKMIPEVETYVSQTAPAAKPQSEVPYNASLNPIYTFETFVVGKNNALAHATALAVAEDPGVYGNPLFIYGGVGLGKTHLMHAIAYYILKQRPNQNILYVTSEDFTNELISAIRNSKNEEFRHKYRNLDMLLIDDIQFIANRESTQEEFFHTFNALKDAKKQIVITSDKLPRELKNLPDRLISRFQNGLIVDVQAPDYETRMAILNKRAELDGININQECLHYIADCIKSNIRELEGALNQINNLSKLKNIPINMEIVQEALSNIISPDAQKPVTPEMIINIVAEHFNITAADIKGQKRSRDIAYPRQICMYLCCLMTDNSLQSIAGALNKSDHTTVIHGEKKIKNDLQKNESLKNTVDILIKKINPPK